MNLILRFYDAFPNFQSLGMLGKIIKKILAKTISIALGIVGPWYLNKDRNRPEYSIGYLSKDRIVEEDLIIVTLTSFPARIKYTYLSIECLMRQSIKPHKIILWLACEQFPGGLESLPPRLLEMQERGLDIRFTTDIRSHKKYFYTFLEFPKSKVITFDDDIYYHKHSISNLLDLHERYPDCIVANRCHRMCFDKKGNLLPYKRWQHNYNSEKPSYFLMHTSGAGVLFNGKAMLHECIFDEQLIKKLSPNSDDVWLKIGLLMNSKRVVTNSRYTKDFVAIKGSQTETLFSTNTHRGEKDKQLIECIQYFDLSDHIKKLRAKENESD